MNKPKTQKQLFLQIESDALKALQRIADSEGRSLETVTNEAIQNYIDRAQKEHHRNSVITAFDSSLKEFDGLYLMLANHT